MIPGNEKKSSLRSEEIGIGGKKAAPAYRNRERTVLKANARPPDVAGGKKLFLLQNPGRAHAS